MCLSSNKAAKQAAAQQAAANAAAVAQAKEQAQQQLAAQQAASAALLAEVQTNNAAQLAAAKAAQEQLIQQLTQQRTDFQSAQADLMKAQQQATTDAAKRAEDAVRLTGQRAKTPNVAARLAANRRAAQQGVSSTMLTGAKGVPLAAFSASLGKITPLGA